MNKVEHQYYLRVLIDFVKKYELKNYGVFEIALFDNEEIYNTIIHFAGLYGISIYAGVDCYNGDFVEGIGDEEQVLVAVIEI